MEGVKYYENFIDNPLELYQWLENNGEWVDSMKRKTASYGVPYNYVQMSYPYRVIPPQLQDISDKIETILGQKSNNCLINHYSDGSTRMGFHSDQTDNLDPSTGIAIVSIGETRILRFRNIQDKSIVHDYPLASGSLVFMSIAVQKEWQHSIPPSDTENGRMSLTFRKIIPTSPTTTDK
eukprot:gene5116-6367_t